MDGVQVARPKPVTGQTKPDQVDCRKSKRGLDRYNVMKTFMESQKTMRRRVSKSCVGLQRPDGAERQAL